MMTASKKGVSAHQIHRSVGISYKTAWFMCHRLREAMRSGGLLPPMGQDGGAVEADETFIGRVKGEPVYQGAPPKRLRDRSSAQFGRDWRSCPQFARCFEGCAMCRRPVALA